MTQPVTLEESAAALGFDSQEGWRTLASGQATLTQSSRWTEWGSRRVRASRIKQVQLSNHIAAAYMPTIALAFQKELSTQFGRLDGPPPATATDHCYSVLMYQIYCSSYFAKWIRMEGEDVINFMEFMWKYISEMAVEDLDLSNFASKVSSHLEIFLQALLYLPPSFSLTLLPSDPKHPSILAVRKFLKKTILLTNVGPYLSPNATSNQVNPMVAEQVLEVAQGLLKWVEKGGKETVEARFSMDRWNVCAGGCLEGCEVEGWEEGGRLKTCTRCRSVVYCSTAHQRRHWIGADMLVPNSPIPLTFAHKNMCFSTAY